MRRFISSVALLVNVMGEYRPVAVAAVGRCRGQPVASGGVVAVSELMPDEFVGETECLARPGRGLVDGEIAEHAEVVDGQISRVL